MEPSFLAVEGISKAFPGVQALSEVTLDVNQGEILALVGENGAGKSTLIKILSGVLHPDEGQIFIQGQSERLASPVEAERQGISVVYQELSLVPNLTVAENVFAGHQPVGPVGLMKPGMMEKRTGVWLDQFDANFKPDTLVGRLAQGSQQLVEIIKALSRNARVLILDEPTSSLTLGETELLFERLIQLKEQNIAIIFISHHLEEVFEISDRISVLRDGKLVGTKNTADTNELEIVQMMVGRKLADFEITQTTRNNNEPLLRVENLSRKGEFEDISFELYPGEVLTFSGLVGAGRTEVARALVGLDPLNKGNVNLKGQRMHITHPRTAMRNGMVYLSEDRKDLGLFLDKSVKENFMAPNLRKVTPSGWISWKKLEKLSQSYVEQLEIRTPSLDQQLRNLSGGNQQKVLLGEWLATEPDVLIVDEPTRGIDVGTKQEIHRLLRELAQQGKGILVISSDLPEVLLISDRIAVMRRGKLVSILDRSETTQERIMELAAGVAK